MLEINHAINGRPHHGGTRFGDVFNPATGEVQAKLRYADAATLDIAVQAAKRAFPGWLQSTPAHRAQILFKFRELLIAHTDAIASLITREHGKTLADARGEVARGLEVVEFFCGIPALLRGDYSENVANGIDSWSVRQPLGVVAAISPFNFPCMIPLWMCPAAIACGNTVVLKPSERDPSVPLLLAQLFAEAGLPDGVLNVVHGDKEVVDAILVHPDIAAISFVGSTPVAEIVRRVGVAHGKRVQAFGGAKNHMVILPDADLDAVVDAALGAGYGAAGERCMAISALVPVSDAVADALVAKLAPRVRGLKISVGTDAEADFGPLITASHLARVKGLVAKGVEEGAELVVDGRDYRLQGYENGFFMGGCLFDHVKAGSTLHHEEIFGPVLSIVRAGDFEQALFIVNGHHYANGTAVYTRDLATARAFAHQVQVGMVGINVPIPVPSAAHGFGGWKASGLYEHGMYGEESLRFFTRRKTVMSRAGAPLSGAAFTMPQNK